MSQASTHAPAHTPSVANVYGSLRICFPSPFMGILLCRPQRLCQRARNSACDVCHNPPVSALRNLLQRGNIAFVIKLVFLNCGAAALYIFLSYQADMFEAVNRYTCTRDTELNNWITTNERLCVFHLPTEQTNPNQQFYRECDCVSFWLNASFICCLWRSGMSPHGILAVMISSPRRQASPWQWMSLRVTDPLSCAD